MIQLTRLNNHPLVVNSDLIKFVEQSPDTVITLVNGDKIVVRESADEVLQRVVQFRRSVMQASAPRVDAGSALPPAPPVRPAPQTSGKLDAKLDANDDGNAPASRPAGASYRAGEE
jgi:flagellar protein FlbD